MDASTPEPRVGPMWVNAHTNAVVSYGEERPAFCDENRHVCRDYFGGDVSAALEAFGHFNGQSDALREIDRVLRLLLETLNTTVHDVYRIDRYVAITLATDPDTIAMFVNRGFVDTRFPLAGLTAHNNGVWRLDLPMPPTPRPSGTHGRRRTVDLVECPHDPGMMVPVHGACPFCEWSPSSDNP